MKCYHKLKWILTLISTGAQESSSVEKSKEPYIQLTSSWEIKIISVSSILNIYWTYQSIARTFPSPPLLNTSGSSGPVPPTTYPTYQKNTNTLSKLMHIQDCTTDFILLFLAGSLPCISANCPCSAWYAIFLGRWSSKVLVQTIQDLCVQYELPNPLLLLKEQRSNAKKQFKNLKVTEYWHRL